MFPPWFLLAWSLRVSSVASQPTTFPWFPLFPIFLLLRLTPPPPPPPPPPPYPLKLSRCVVSAASTSKVALGERTLPNPDALMAQSLTRVGFASGSVSMTRHQIKIRVGATTRGSPKSHKTLIWNSNKCGERLQSSVQHARPWTTKIVLTSFLTFDRFWKGPLMRTTRLLARGHPRDAKGAKTNTGARRTTQHAQRLLHTCGSIFCENFAVTATCRRMQYSD